MIVETLQEQIKSRVPWLNDLQITRFIGHATIYGTLEAKTLTKLLDLKKEQVSELFKLLIDPENGVLSGKYEGNNFIVSSFKIGPLRADFSDLSEKEIKVLGLLMSHPDGIKVSEIGKMLSLKNEEILDVIYRLASKSVCAICTKNGFFLVDFVTVSAPRDLNELEPEEKELIGLLLTHELQNIRKLSELLGRDKKDVISTLLRLVAEGTITGKFREKQDFSLEKLSFDQLPVDPYLLEGGLRDVVGLLVAYKEIEVKKASHLISQDELTLRKNIYSLACDGTINVYFEEDKIRLENLSEISQTMDIEELSDSHKKVTGMIIAYKSIPIKQMKKKLNVAEIDLLRLIFDLLLYGIINGFINKDDIFVLKKPPKLPSPYSRELNEKELITLGAIIAHKTLTTSFIRKLLISCTNKSPEEERKIITENEEENIIYDLLAENFIKGQMTNGTFTLEYRPPNPFSPPFYSLPETTRTILGYMLGKSTLNPKNLSNLLKTPRENVQCEIYKLISQGIITVDIVNNEFHLPNPPQILVARTPKELGGKFQELTDLLKDEEEIKIKQIAEKLGLPKDEVVLMYSLLLGEGIFKGKIENNKLIIESGPHPLDPRFKAKCYWCGELTLAVEEKCSSCKEKIPWCSVCNNPIQNGEDAKVCPKCNKPAHKSHLLEYLRTKGECPSCGSKIKGKTLKPLEKIKQKKENENSKETTETTNSP
ncbi:MAG: RING finger protein [Candidatus Wukongarchaeota archaeon]|nr:hypothetical protein [Candidatus Wukongarchaeota archaeon]